MSNLDSNLVYIITGSCKESDGRKEVLAHATTRGQGNEWTVYRRTSNSDRLVSQTIERPNNSTKLRVMGPGIRKTSSQVQEFLEYAEANKSNVFISDDDWKIWIEKIEGKKSDGDESAKPPQSSRSANDSTPGARKANTVAKAVVAKGNRSG